MLLEDRSAIVYGAGGFVGEAVARAFAREGARVHLTGRTASKLAAVAGDITAEGGRATSAEVDVLDEVAVEEHAADVAAAGGLDVAFNAVSYGDVQGAPLAELPYEHLAAPVTTALRAHFLTVRAAARHMVPPGAGVVLTVTGHGPPYPDLGGTAVAWSLVEALYRQWACELGAKGVRVAWLRTGGFTESVLGAAAYDLHRYADGGLLPLAEQVADTAAEEELRWLEGETMLRRLPSLREAGEAAAFLASDQARSFTATALNLTAGGVAD